MKNIPETFRGSSSGHQYKRIIKPVIDIVIQGGTITDIVDIPENTTVRIWDYDTDGIDAGELFESPYDEGKQAVLTYWE
jgi:hypothetical protein